MKTISTILSRGCFIFALATLATVGAQAQPSSEGGQSDAPQQQSAQFTDQQLENFIAVLPDLQTIRSEFTQRIQNAEDDAAAAELQTQANERMVQALADYDLNPQLYNQIASALQQNQGLRERVQGMLDEAQGEDQSG